MVFYQPYCKVSFVVAAGLTTRKTAARYLRGLERFGILVGEKRGRNVVYRHPAFSEVLAA